MNTPNFLDGFIESKLLNLHTAFVGKVLSVGAGYTSCTVQPLARIKAFGKEAQNQSVVTNVPILKHARVKDIELHCNESTHEITADITYIEPGDVVLCVCGERDISETIGGGFATPPQGHHNLTDAVVVGIFN